MGKNATKLKPSVTLTDWLHASLQRAGVFHFILLIGYGIQVVMYDATKVLTPEAVLKRWYALAGLLVISGVVWYLAHNKNNDIATYKRLIFLLISADIAFASFNIYTQRGMASRAVILYTVPIVLSAILLSRAAIFATALFSAAAYLATAVAYFTYNFNEGYKAELYSEVLFYGFSFIVLAGILSAIVRFGGSSANS